MPSVARIFKIGRKKKSLEYSGYDDNLRSANYFLGPAPHAQPPHSLNQRHLQHYQQQIINSHVMGTNINSNNQMNNLANHNNANTNNNISNNINNINQQLACNCQQCTIQNTMQQQQQSVSAIMSPQPVQSTQMMMIASNQSPAHQPSLNQSQLQQQQQQLSPQTPTHYSISPQQPSFISQITPSTISALTPQCSCQHCPFQQQLMQQQQNQPQWQHNQHMAQQICTPQQHNIIQQPQQQQHISLQPQQQLYMHEQNENQQHYINNGQQQQQRLYVNDPQQSMQPQIVTQTNGQQSLQVNQVHAINQQINIPNSHNDFNQQQYHGPSYTQATTLTQQQQHIANNHTVTHLDEPNCSNQKTIQQQQNSQSLHQSLPQLQPSLPFQYHTIQPQQHQFQKQQLVQQHHHHQQQSSHNNHQMPVNHQTIHSLHQQQSQQTYQSQSQPQLLANKQQYQTNGHLNQSPGERQTSQDYRLAHTSTNVSNCQDNNSRYVNMQPNSQFQDHVYYNQKLTLPPYKHPPSYTFISRRRIQNFESLGGPRVTYSSESQVFQKGKDSCYENVESGYGNLGLMRNLEPGYTS